MKTLKEWVDSVPNLTDLQRVTWKHASKGSYVQDKYKKYCEEQAEKEASEFKDVAISMSKNYLGNLGDYLDEYDSSVEVTLDYSETKATEVPEPEDDLSDVYVPAPGG